MILNSSLVNLKDDVLEINCSGELFLFQNNRAQSQFQYLVGEKHVSDEAVANFHDNQSHLNNMSHVYGFRFCNIVTPSKPVIKRKELKDVGIDVASIYNSYFNDTSSGTIYPVELLTESNSTCKSDTHYNGVGQWLLVKKLLQVLLLPYKDLIPVFSIKNIVGDLAKMRGMTSGTDEPFFEGFQGLDDSTKLFTNKEALKGNSGHVCYAFNRSALFEKKLLIFGDSFALQCLGLLSCLFEDVVYIRNPFVIEDVLRVSAPDFVVTQQAERYLVNSPSFRKSPPFFMKFLSTNYNPANLSEDDISAIQIAISGNNSQVLNWKNKIS